jgi:hypothetical protein
VRIVLFGRAVPGYPSCAVMARMECLRRERLWTGLEQGMGSEGGRFGKSIDITILN